MIEVVLRGEDGDAGRFESDLNVLRGCCRDFANSQKRLSRRSDGDLGGTLLEIRQRNLADWPRHLQVIGVDVPARRRTSVSRGLVEEWNGLTVLLERRRDFTEKTSRCAERELQRTLLSDRTRRLIDRDRRRSRVS